MRNATLAAAIAGALGTLCATLAAAQQAPATGATVLEEVVVTAQKRPERLQDVPIAMTVVNAEQLANQHVYTIADLARTTPALEVIQAFGGPGGGGQIRGIGTQSFTRSAEGAVGVVVDGVPQGNVNFNNIFDVQQVEVLRGPQGTLFGLTSSAGVINMTTVAPDPAKFAAKAQVDYSDQGTAGSKFGEQTVRVAVNLPLSGAGALRLSVSGDRLSGVERNAFDGSDNVAKDFSARARYRWSGSDNLQVNVIADVDHRTANYADPQFVYVNVPAGTPLAAELAACGIVASYANQSRCAQGANGDSVRNYGLSAQFDWKLDAGTLTSISAYRKNETGPGSVDIMGTPAEFTQIFATGSITSGRLFSQELRLASGAGQTVEYVAGLFYSDYAADGGNDPGGAFNVGSNQLAPFFINFVKSSDATHTTNKAAAAFGQLTWHATDQLAWIAGARFTHQTLTDYDASTNFLAPPPGVTVTSGDTSQNNFSGKLGVQYRFDANLTGYFTVTRGYKGPQVVPANLGSPSTVVAAELPLAFELGLKGSVLDGKLGIDSSVFSTKVKNYQGQRLGINGVGVLVATPESVDVTTKGVEVDLYGHPLVGLTLNGGFLYDDAEYPTGWTGYNPNDLRDPLRDASGIPLLGQGTTDLSGRQVVGAPKTKFTLSGEYAWGVGGVQGFVGADAVHKSDLLLGATADPRFVYPAHWTYGARLGVRGADERWSVSLFGRNLGNNIEPVTLFGGPSFIPPGAVPFIPNGQINGISGWLSPASLRQVGLSAQASW